MQKLSQLCTASKLLFLTEFLKKYIRCISLSELVDRYRFLRLHLDAWGGRSLNEDRSRSRKWKWTDNAANPAPFKPIHLSLNKNIGVRVVGRESVLVTFLGSGQQARFSVGGCAKVQYVSYDSNLLRHVNERPFTERCVYTAQRPSSVVPV